MPREKRRKSGKKKPHLNVLKPELFSSSFGTSWVSNSSINYDPNEDGEPEGSTVLDLSTSSRSSLRYDLDDSDRGYPVEGDVPPDMCESSSSELENSGQGQRGTQSGDGNGVVTKRRLTTVRFKSQVNLRRKWIRENLLEVQKRTQPKHRTLSAPPSILRHPKPQEPLTTSELQELLGDYQLKLLEEQKDLWLAQKERESVENSIRDLKQELQESENLTKLDATAASEALSALLHRPQFNVSALGTSIADMQQAIWWLQQEEIPKFDRANRKLKESCHRLREECEWLRRARERRQQLLATSADDGLVPVRTKAPSSCMQEKPELMRVPLPTRSFEHLDSSVHSLAA